MRAPGLLVKATAAATILLTTSVLSGGAPAQSPSETPPAAAAVQPGDIAAAGFSGTKLQLDKLPPGVDPIAKTVIDPDGYTLQIIDGGTLTGPLTAQKQLSPARREFKARDIGHVFGLAFDDTPADGTPSPGLFAGATSAFGLRIMGPDKDGDGKPDRLEKGAPGATFMEGQFGGLPGGGPGSIWKVDRATGAVSLFADVGVGGVKNSGPGIGGLAFDPASRTLYASDLDTGLIHRLSIANGGTDQGQFDYGVTARPNLGKPVVKDDGKRLEITSPNFDPAQPATWGYTQRERRIDALAVHGGRLYFAVAEGPEIWSVGLETDGAFKPDARFEIAVDGEKPALITGLAFDGGGNMIVAQRGDVQNPRDYLSFAAAVPPRVLRYTAEGPDDPATPGLWQKPPEEYAVGNADDNRSSSGGVALEYGFNTDGTLDTNTCSGTIVASADALGPARAVHGLQLNAASLVRPANVPPNESAFVNWNPTLDDAKARGYTGGIAVLHTCGSGAGFPPVAGDDTGVGGGFPPVAGDPGGAAFPPVAGGAALPPVEGVGTPEFPPVEGRGGGKVQDLQVTKTAGVTTCSPKGGCAFAVTVSNPNPEPIPGPIVIDERIEAPQATMTGEPNAPWTCTKAAPFTCTHPGPVPANGALDMRVVFAPNTPAETKEVRNCVALNGAAQALPAEQCATIALDPNAPVQSGPVIVAKKGAGKCTAKGPCAFTITLQNTLEINTGEFQINEVIDAPQATLVGEPNAPWTCTKTAPFTCKHPGLPAKSTTELQLSFAPNTPPEKKELKNCAVPTTFTGGKKTDLDFKRGFGRALRDSLIQPASLRGSMAGSSRYQSFDPSLLHLVGGAGGNFGPGFTSNRCLVRGIPPSFDVRQTNGATIRFSFMKIDSARVVTGEATVLGTPTRGAVSGFFDGGASTKLLIKWNNGQVAEYNFKIDDAGKMTGDARELGGPGVGIASGAAWPCTRDEICDRYTTQATAQVKEFQALKCGTLPVNMSPKPEDHLNWCMGQPKSSPFINSEGQARAKALEACKAKNAEIAALCDAHAVKTVAIKNEMKALNCKVLFPDRTVELEALFCRSSTLPVSILTLQEQKRLDRCKLEQANAGGGAGGGAGAGPATQPAPEQCAVVPIDPETPDGGGKVEPAPVPQASLAGTLALTKTAGVCKANRSCDFTITVANTANAPFNGPVDFADETTGDGAFFGSAALTALQPWTCPKNGQSFACTATLTLAANEKKDFQFTADLGGGAGAGVVKEMKNCATLKGAPAPSCATAPLAQVQPPPAPPPADPNGLVLTKRRGADKCSDLGGGCVFIVRITNSSQAEFNGPIEFTDVIKTADGQTLPNATLESQPHITLDDGAVAAISCAKAGDTVTCGTGGANAKIPPGKFVDAQLTMKPGPAGGATAIRNCALLKSGGGQSCSSMSLVNGPLLRASKFGGGDTCLPTCTFAVVITNIGNADAEGPITFQDLFTPATSLGAYTVATDNAKCTNVNGTFFCFPTAKVLKPGELTNIGIRIFGTAKAPEYKNCATLGTNEKYAIDLSNLDRCKTVKDTSPQTPNLVIRKQAPNRKGASSDGHCNLKSDCRFTITVTNTGLAPFTGPLRVTDTVSLGVPQSIGIGPGSPQSLPWKCDGVQNGVGALIAQSSIKCELPPLPNGLAPGTTATLEVQVIPGATWKGSDRLKNCAEITSDGDIGANAQKQDCAEVILDPFNVKVAKTGDQSCPPGSNCTFKITLFNPGPIPHNAPVTITDALSPRVSAQIVSINPPLPCATQPSSIPFSCTSPGPVRLDLDAPAGSEFGPREFTMVVKMPSDGSAETYRNCISVAADATSAGEEACHTVTTKPKALTVSKTATSASCDETTPCNFKVTVTNTGAEPVAGPIAIADLTRVGRTPLTQVKLVSASAPWTCIASAAPGMQCSHPGPLPPNSTLNLDLSLQPLPGSLAGASEVRNCAGLAGSSTAEPGACVAIPVKATPTPPEAATCTGGMVMTARGCACPAPTKLKGSECVGAGGINTTPQTPPPAAPPPPVATSPAAPSCSGGMILIEGSCACPPAMKWNGRECVGTGGINTSTQPQTPPPAAPPPAPVVTSPAPPSCSGGMILIEGSCACPPAMKWNGRACVGTGGINKIDPTVDEDSKQPRPQSPQCPDGFVGTPPKCCPRGTEFRDGACRGPQATPAVRNCPEGFVGTPPRCCPRGTQFRDGACRGPQATTPVEKTKPKVCPPNLPVGKFPNCCPINARFNGTQCRCLPGFEFRRGQCLPARPQPPTACPRGQIFINGQCRRLSIPTPQPQQPQPQGKCPPSAPEGTPPNCRCPAGTVSRDGFCRPANCPPNMTGTPPNCNRICPAGTVNRNQECVPVPQPGPVGPSPKPVPQKPQRTPCPPGWDGDFQPNCAKPPS